MSVRSMREVLDSFASNHLSQVVPEDVDLVHDISTILSPVFCPEGHLHGMKPLVRVNIWAKWPEGPGGEQIPPVNICEAIPAEFVHDGDTEPLRYALDELWEAAQFMSMTHSALPGLYGVLQELAPDQVEDDEDDDEEVIEAYMEMDEDDEED